MSYLLLGARDEPLLTALAAALREAGRDVYHLAAPLVAPQCFSWWLDDKTSHSELRLEDGMRLRGTEIEGVLLRPGLWLRAEGWAAGEREYVQAETESVLFAWLHSLDCMVINRYSARQWFGLQSSLLDWQALLWRVGLSTGDMLVTNVAGAGQAAMAGQAAVLMPLVSMKRYRIRVEADWMGLEQVQQLMPVCLSEGYTREVRAAVIGDEVVWDGDKIETLEARLGELARAAGLSFMAVEFGANDAGWRVTGVEMQPQLARFNVVAQGYIVAALARLLSGDRGTAKR